MIRLLMRHFFARMLDGEWSSTPGQWQSVVVGVFATALPASMAMLNGPRRFAPGHRAQELAMLTLFMAVSGLIAVVQWQNLFPGRRDYLALAGLPVRSWQIFVARFGAVVVFSTVLVAAMNLLPAIGAPAARWGASVLGCFFMFFAVATLQGVLLNLLPAKWFARVSSLVQGVLIGMLMLAGLFSWSIRDWRSATLDLIPRYGFWAPPVWFASHDMRGWWACGLVACLTVGSYLVSYRRYRRLLIEAPVHLTVPGKRSWSVLSWFAGDPRTEAILHFMAKTLARSRAQRVLWLAYVGGTIGVLLNSSLIDGGLINRTGDYSKGLKFIVLFWPLGSAMVILNGLRHVFSIPADLPANWIFRISESHGRRAWMRAVERFVILYAVAPVYVLLGPLAVYLVGWPIALRLLVLQILVSLTLYEVLFYSWQQLPFACSYTPGKRSLSMVLGAYFGLLAVVVPILSLIVRAAAEFSGLFLIYFPVFAAAWIATRRRRMQGWGESPLIYEDVPGGMPNLGIRELSWHAQAKETL